MPSCIKVAHLLLFTGSCCLERWSSNKATLQPHKAVSKKPTVLSIASLAITVKGRTANASLPCGFTNLRSSFQLTRKLPETSTQLRSCRPLGLQSKKRSSRYPFSRSRKLRQPLLMAHASTSNTTGTRTTRTYLSLTGLKRVATSSRTVT